MIKITSDVMLNDIITYIQSVYLQAIITYNRSWKDNWCLGYLRFTYLDTLIVKTML